MSTKKESGKLRKDPMRRVRKIGEREETFDVPLTSEQISEKREEICVLLDEEERIEAKKDESLKSFGSQLKTNRTMINDLRRTVNAGKQRMVLVVEEYLTEGNEVIRVRKGTDDQIGAPRTATGKELQEEMFDDSKPEDPGHVQQDAASQQDEGFGEFDEPGAEA